MKLLDDQKFILKDDDGNLILITDIDLGYELLQNKIIPMEGIIFEVDYENNKLGSGKKVELQTSFEIDGIYTEDD